MKYIRTEIDHRNIINHSRITPEYFSRKAYTNDYSGGNSTIRYGTSLTGNHTRIFTRYVGEVFISMKL